MKNIFKKFLNIIKFIFLSLIWQSLQNLIGLIVFLVANENKTKYLTTVSCKFYFIHKGTWGVTLGDFIMLSENDGLYELKHEAGHKKQSQILGPLYLIIIGIPSALFNVYDKIVNDKIKNLSINERNHIYYNVPWEKWANKLSGIDGIV